MPRSTTAPSAKARQNTKREPRPSSKTCAGTVPKVNVGQCLRELRLERNLSICARAERSGLNVNTFSLIENGKTSPSVSTLQQRHRTDHGQNNATWATHAEQLQDYQGQVDNNPQPTAQSA